MASFKLRGLLNFGLHMDLELNVIYTGTLQTYLNTRWNNDRLTLLETEQRTSLPEPGRTRTSS